MDHEPYAFTSIISFNLNNLDPCRDILSLTGLHWFTSFQNSVYPEACICKLHSLISASLVNFKKVTFWFPGCLALLSYITVGSQLIRKEKHGLWALLELKRSGFLTGAFILPLRWQPCGLSHAFLLHRKHGVCFFGHPEKRGWGGVGLLYKMESEAHQQLVLTMGRMSRPCV